MVLWLWWHYSGLLNGLAIILTGVDIDQLVRCGPPGREEPVLTHSGGEQHMESCRSDCSLVSDDSTRSFRREQFLDTPNPMHPNDYPMQDYPMQDCYQYPEEDWNTSNQPLNLSYQASTIQNHQPVPQQHINSIIPQDVHRRQHLQPSYNSVPRSGQGNYPDQVHYQGYLQSDMPSDLHIRGQPFGHQEYK